MRPNKNIHTSDFNRHFIDLNGMNNFSEWFFYSGMLFSSFEKWWGEGGRRPAPHEGLDICYYKNSQGLVCSLGENINIPVMYDGIVYHISDDDFLGKSIFVRHEVVACDSKILHSVYAHSIPVDGIKKNTRLTEGEVLAKVADVRDRNLLLPGHLHLSMVWLPEDYPQELLTWRRLAKSNQVSLVDPFIYLNLDYSIEDYLGVS